MSRDIYAGGDAWRSWFARCAVSRCSQGEQKLLDREISSAFARELSYHGVNIADYASEDFCSYFDSHFYLGGRRDSPKPLKAYYSSRVDMRDDEALRQLICGTFFSKKCGKCKNIVREEIIPLLKGWRAHIVGGKIVWERPLSPVFDDDGNEVEPMGSIVEPELFDEDLTTWTHEVSEIFKILGRRISPKSDTDAPLIVYAIASGIPPSRSAVCRLLGISPGMANRKFHQVREEIARFIKRKIIVDDCISFMKALFGESKSRMENILGELEEA